MRRLLTIAALFLFAGTSEGASVKKLLKKSKKVVIDEGKKTGFEKGKTACVYTSDDEEIVCAEIYKAKKKNIFA